METLLQDLRFAARTLLRSRGFALAAVLTLALGIGANTAIFSVVNGVLLRPLPFEEPDRLTVLWMNNTTSSIEKDVTSPPNFLDWRSRGTSFEAMAALAPTSRNLTATEQPERLPSAVVSDGFFGMMGVRPVLGRGFVEEEHAQGAGPVVVLGQGLWARRFGADPGIVGRTISLNSVPHEVVGVMPTGFDYPEGAQVWLPLRIAPDASRGSLFLSVVGRLREGVPLEQAQAQMTTIARDLEREYPEANEGNGILLEPLPDVLVGEIRPALLVLLGAVGFVLLIACANVANLLFARSTIRQKEIAIRAAIGAARGRVVRQALTESMLLALAGGAAGLLLAYWGVELLLRVAPADLPRAGEVGVDSTVLLFTLAASLATGVLFGLLPALQISRPDLTAVLREGGRGATGTSGNRLRRVLVAAEVALALVLLVGAGLMVRSFAALQAVDPGFRTDGVLTFGLSLTAAKYPEPPQVANLYEEVLTAVEALPGVEGASAASTILLERLPNSAGLVVEGRPDLPEAAANLEVPFDAVTPGFFETMGIELLAGRGFSDRDGPEAVPAAIVNRALAERFFPGEDPVGKRVALGRMPESDEGWTTVVGVVEDVRRSGLNLDPRPEIYFPHRQFTSPFMSVVVRSSVDPRTLMGPIREAVRAIDPDLPLADVTPLEQALAETVATQRFSTLLLGLFSLVAVLLAVVGIYGLMAYTVGQRTREIGVRIALGAQRSEVLAMITRQAFFHVLPGLVVGLVGAFALTRLLESLLYGVSATDPLTFAGVALLLAGVALLAGYLPARRAARVDPIEALRAE